MIRLAALLAVLAAPAAAQDAETLADIRRQLSALDAEMGALSRELQSTGAAALGIAGTSYPERVEALEAQLQRLTTQTERLSFRVESVARDGGSRIEDLRFQLCELTPDCDLGALPDPGPLGGEGGTGAGGGAAPAPATGGPQLAVGEEADFEAARAALEAGNAADAAQRLDRFLQSYPTGPLTIRAQLLRGEALAATGAQAEAARAYLEAFSGAPEGAQAPAALLGLGRTLGALGQTQEACLTLTEIEVRFPGAAEAGEARSAKAGLGCG